VIKLYPCQDARSESGACLATRRPPGIAPNLDRLKQRPAFQSARQRRRPDATAKT